jgi:uncharacterized membrane protein
VNPANASTVTFHEAAALASLQPAFRPFIIIAPKISGLRMIGHCVRGVAANPLQIRGGRRPEQEDAGKGERMKSSITAAMLVGAVLAILSPRAAHADFRVCNATQNLVGVAIGYRAAAGWITEGWWHIDGSSCKTLIEGPLASRFYYLYAEDAERGGRWGGPVSMCVADNEFKIVGVRECISRGYQRAGFQEHDTGDQPSWMVQLADEVVPENSATLPGGTP